MPNPKQSAAGMRFKTGSFGRSKRRGSRAILKNGVFIEHVYTYGARSAPIIALVDVQQFYDEATQYLKDRTPFAVDVLKYGELDRGWWVYEAYDNGYGGAAFVMQSPGFLVEPWDAPSHSYIYVTYAPNINYVSVLPDTLFSRSDDWEELGHDRVGAHLAA